MLFAIIAVSTLVLDQLTKAIVRATMHPGESSALIEDVLHLTYVRNTGAAFGLMPGQQTMFIAVAVLVLLGVSAYLWLMRPHSRIESFALGLVAGGAVGNLIDRVVSGRVTDFLDIQILPIFNVADAGIVVGAIVLVAWTVFAPGTEDEDPAVLRQATDEAGRIARPIED